MSRAKRCVVVLALTLSLSGCTAIKIKLVEHFINKVVTGYWEKVGVPREEYYNDNWLCQRDTSRWDPELGMVFDLKAYYNCMIGKGWTLRPYKIEDL